MVKKGEYINFASNLEVENTMTKEPEYSTEFSCIIEMAKKIKELEERITQLELKK